ncbi:TerB N-terminal domain-containing protein [Thermophilibacter provencensis]|uniref:TerB N-terminal domain-containing protein n=1 Tax=Thermophilibacter provencensis TaxID=1852386 RepID=A0ABT7V0E0_9ACTN|nr:TerB N-terminal domain-containing protein [Thermophilibacter provencensis]MDM8270077.1 TerB N-terminal domain-containing protein [Thermophilibacter provencensis]
MRDIDAIIEQIIAASRAKAGHAFASSRVYSDEPIIMRGSQLASYVPEPIRQMRALARRPEARSWSDARLFVEQARLMAGYTDDFPYEGTFSSYFPTYAVMGDRQLRGYFTWRTRVRDGHVEKTSASFAYVYLYELINGIGAEPGEPAFRAIEAFWQAYRTFEPTMDRYVRPWLVDYVVYHGLDATLATPYLNSEHDRAVCALAKVEKSALLAAPTRGRRKETRDFGALLASGTGLIDALDLLSTYRIRESRLYRDDPDALTTVTFAVFEQLARYYHGSRTQGLTESLFGVRHAMPHLMFASAVFYPGAKHEDCVFELDETCRFTCQNGIWSCDALHDGGARSAKLGQILRAVDRQLRLALDYPHPLKEHGDPKYLIKIIDREAQDYLAWRRAHAPRRIEIDLSKLAGIRAGAALTREALLVDEEREEEVVAPEPHQGDEKDTSLNLTPAELALVRTLLEGGQPDPANVDLLVDSINEKLFDLVGDTVVEFDDSGAPTLIEDYVEDVREALGA